MADSLKAFFEFLIDLFSALATFLGGEGDFDFINTLKGILGGDDAGEEEPNE